MLQNKKLLQNRKNLLAFSAGVDSTALLFLLLESHITFDIAIVDYQIREASKEEVSYAKELACRYNFKCHLLSAQKIEKNFEANARAIRYNFFEQLINEHKYENLLTAHHLGDRFEWMLMQFCKGAGCIELSGMQAIDTRQNYTLLRPLLHLDKSELLEYLHSKNLHYFVDESNTDKKYKRNEFRHNYAQPMLSKYLQGIKKSFSYIDEDRDSMLETLPLLSSNELYYFQTSQRHHSNIWAIDKYFKSIGILISAHERKLLKDNEEVIISRRFIVSKMQKYTFIAPYMKAVDMKKEFKEKMRLLKISPKLRGYLATDEESVALVSLLLQ